MARTQSSRRAVAVRSFTRSKVGLMLKALGQNAIDREAAAKAALAKADE